MPDELRLTLHLCGFKHQHSVSIKPTSSNIFLVWTRELLATISMKRPFSFSHECCDLKMRWLGENFVFLLLNLHPHFLLPVFPEQYESFVKFTQDQIMRRYGARPASCKYLKPPLSSEIIRVHFLFYLPSQGRSDCYLVWPQHLSTVSIIFCFRCLLNSHDETPPPPASSHKMAALLLPCSSWFSFYLPIFLPPSISNCLGAMVYPLFNPKVDFLLCNYCCWPKVRRIWKINNVWGPTLFSFFFFCPFSCWYTLSGNPD